MLSLCRFALCALALIPVTAGAATRQARQIADQEVVDHLLGRDVLPARVAEVVDVNFDGATDAADLPVISGVGVEVISDQIGILGGTFEFDNSQIDIPPGVFPVAVDVTAAIRERAGGAIAGGGGFDPEVSSDFVRELSINLGGFTGKSLGIDSDRQQVKLFSFELPVDSAAGFHNLAYSGIRAGEQALVSAVDYVEEGTDTANYDVFLNAIDLALIATQANPTALRFVAGFTRVGKLDAIPTDLHDIETGQSTAQGYVPPAAENIILCIHGLSSWERMWGPLRQGLLADSAMASALAGGYDVWGVRYNTGRPVAESGASVADLLNTQIGTSQEIQNVYIVSHSMGGLVAREAIAAAIAQNQPWVSKVQHVTFIASPHDGTPLGPNLRDRLVAGEYMKKRNPEAEANYSMASVLQQTESQGVSDLEAGLRVGDANDCLADADIPHSVIYGTALGGLDDLILNIAGQIINEPSDGAVPTDSAQDIRDGILCINTADRVTDLPYNHFSIYPGPELLTADEVLADDRYLTIQNEILTFPPSTRSLPAATVTPTTTPIASP